MDRQVTFIPMALGYLFYSFISMKSNRKKIILFQIPTNHQYEIVIALKHWMYLVCLVYLNDYSWKNSFFEFFCLGGIYWDITN